MVMNPQVSVIIPIYNVEKYLKKCLDSLVNQTLKNIEFICINDGSTDNSLEILQKYANDDSRFKIISQENQGQGIARNKGVALASGEYIAFIDPDDWVEYNAFKLLYNYAKERNSQIVQFNFKEYNDYSGVLKNVSFAEKIKRIYNYDLLKTPYYIWRDLKKGCLCELDLHVWVHFYSAQFIKENNIQFAPSRRGEDHLFANSAKLLAARVDYLNEFLYFHRSRKGSVVNTKGGDNFCIFDNINRLESFIKTHNLWCELEKEFDTYKKNVIKWHYGQTPMSRIKEFEDICKNILNKDDFNEVMRAAKGKNSFWENVFSIKNKREDAIKYKTVTVLGMEFIFAPKPKNISQYKLEQNPLVSIIIPIYNAEQTLSKCLSEIINQSYTNIEVICVDDGSTDCSYEILKYFSKKDNRIKVYSQKNSGPAQARNFAIKQATGDFLMFCDADDWYLPHTVERMLDAICTHNVDLVMCDCNIIDLSSKNIQSDESNDYHRLYLKGFHKIDSGNIENINVVLWNKIFRRDFIEKYNIEYPSEYEQDDLIFVYKYLSNVKTFYGLNDTLYNYVVGNPNSIMGKVFTQTNTKSKYDFIFAWQNLYDYLKIYPHRKSLEKYFIKDNFKKLQYYYSILSEKDQKQAFLYIQEFINKNTGLLEYKAFKQIASIDDFKNFQKKFYLCDSSLKWYQLIFSIKNSANKTQKVFRILGFKCSVKREKNNV